MVFALRQKGKAVALYGRGGEASSPDQAAARIIAYLRVGMEEFVLERFQTLLIQRQLELQSPIGYAPTLPGMLCRVSRLCVVGERPGRPQ